MMVDETTGEKQIWFIPQKEEWRMSLDNLVEAVRLAEEWVAYVPPVTEKDLEN